MSRENHIPLHIGDQGDRVPHYMDAYIALMGVPAGAFMEVIQEEVSRTPEEFIPDEGYVGALTKMAELPVDYKGVALGSAVLGSYLWVTGLRAHRNIFYENGMRLITGCGPDIAHPPETETRRRKALDYAGALATGAAGYVLGSKMGLGVDMTGAIGVAGGASVYAMHMSRKLTGRFF